MHSARLGGCAATLVLCACTSSTAGPPPPSSDGGGATSTSTTSSGSTSSASGSASSSNATGSPIGTSGGDGGTATTGDAGGADGGAPGCNGLAFCDDFDTYAAGGAPGSTLWTVVGDQGCSGQGAVVYPVTVDDTQSHSPPNSVKITGGDSCGPLMLAPGAFSKISSDSDVYGRFYLYLSSTSATFDHAAMMTLGLASNGDAGINFGNQGTFLQLASEGAGNATNVFMWQTDDSHVLPDKDTAGGAQSAYPAAATWTCVEFHTSPSTDAIQTWIGGAQSPVAGLTFPPPVANVNDQWEGGLPTLPAFQFESLGFGWIVYSGVNMTLWIDDVALSDSGRIGCN